MPLSQLPPTPPPMLPPDLWTFLLVMAISTASGVVSITRRIVRGTPFSALWFISEFLAAILCGWLAYDAYPLLYPYFPEWATMPMFVAVASHTGGRLLQVSEHLIYARLPKSLRDFDQQRKRRK